jgi:transcriptional regulator with XRE-family HTH domain
MAQEVSLTATARRVRAEMAGQQRTQTDLARALGMTTQAVSRRMQGYVDFSSTELARVAQFLDVSVESLLLGDTEANADRVGAA